MAKLRWDAVLTGILQVLCLNIAWYSDDRTGWKFSLITWRSVSKNGDFISCNAASRTIQKAIIWGGANGVQDSRRLLQNEHLSDEERPELSRICHTNEKARKIRAFYYA